MQSTSSGYTDAVTSPTQTPASVVLVDWNRDGWSVGDPIDDITRYVERVEVDSAITSDLPDSTRMVAGYAATEARIDLVSDPDDNTRSAAELWSPYATDSPYYGKTRIGAPFLAELGLQTADGPVALPQINGLVTEIDVRADGRVATMSVLDGAEILRGPVHLPQMIAADPDDPNMRPGLNSQAVIERVLALGGFYASPPPRAGAVLAATLHGSAWPQVGTLRSATVVGPVAVETVPYERGVWGLAVSTPAGDTADITWDIAPAPVENGAGLLVEAWVARPATVDMVLHGRNAEFGTTGAGRDWELTVDSAGVVSWSVSRMLGSSALVSTVTGMVPDDGAMHYVAVYTVFGSASMNVTIRVDDTDTSTTVALDT
ncbi:MAG TPA: hypothetical protein VIS06_01470, partial [Mycobacteriales bacterium]